MHARWKRWIGLAAVGGALFICALYVHATTFNVSIDSTAFSGVEATLVFDFIDGGPPNNTVSLSALTSDGTQVATFATDGVSGTGPWTFSDACASCTFNELLVSFGPLGTSLSFSFSTTDNPPEGGSSPDAFSFFVLDSSGGFLITTDAPFESNALFEFDITGLGAEGLRVYTPTQSGYSIQVSAPGVAPEPGSLALLAAGFVALFVRKRFKQ